MKFDDRARNNSIIFAEVLLSNPNLKLKSLGVMPASELIIKRIFVLAIASLLK